VTMKVNRVL